MSTEGKCENGSERGKFSLAAIQKNEQEKAKYRVGLKRELRSLLGLQPSEYPSINDLETSILEKLLDVAYRPAGDPHTLYVREAEEFHARFKMVGMMNSRGEFVEAP